MIFVAFLFPLAVYCLILGLINRRHRPLMVSAAWDFAGLLFAVSGFLAFGLPAILSGFSEHGRRVLLFGRPPAADGDHWSWLWEPFEGLCSSLVSAGNGAVLLTYFAIVVAVCACVLWRRQGQTAVYNVYPEVFDEVLAAVLDAGGLTWSRAGERYFIARPDKVRPAADAAERRGGYPATAEEIERSAYLEVEAAPAVCHVTLHWQTADEELRKQVEAELKRALAELRTRHNPAGGWLLTAGTLLLSVAVILFVFVIAYRLFGQH